jgi:hypothetical protein
MRRREFIGLAGAAAAAWPTTVAAQQARVYKVGALLLANADADAFRRELREELRKAAFVEGPNLIFEFRSVEEALLPKVAAELVALKVDVLIAL